MRLLELIQPVQEIETLPRGGYDPWFVLRRIKAAKALIPNVKIKEWRNGIKYFVDSSNDTIFATDGVEITGLLDYSTLANGTKIAHVHVVKKWRGRGIGSALYAIALDLFGTVYSDNQQTMHGQRMWASLHNKPGVEVFAALTINPKFITAVVEKELKKLGAKLYKSDRFGQDIYLIPVDTTEKMRRLTTKSRLLPLYNGRSTFSSMLLMATKKIESK